MNKPLWHASWVWMFSVKEDQDLVRSGLSNHRYTLSHIRSLKVGWFQVWLIGSSLTMLFKSQSVSPSHSAWELKEWILACVLELGPLMMPRWLPQIQMVALFKGKDNSHKSLDRSISKPTTSNKNRKTYD